MQQVQLRCRVRSSLTEAFKAVLAKAQLIVCSRRTLTIHILSQCHKLGALPSQFSQGKMRRIWISVQSHVSSVAVELPYERWIGLESLWSRKGGRFMISPDAASTTKGWETRRSRKTSATQGEYTSRLLEMFGEGLAVFGGNLVQSHDGRNCSLVRW